MRSISSILFLILLLELSSSYAFASSSVPEKPRKKKKKPPVVLFPGFHFSKLQVTVDGQDAFPECPSFGNFEDWFPNDHFSTHHFSQECQDKLVTLVYNPDTSKPMSERFSEQNGVTVAFKEYGKTESAPFYEPIFAALEADGYVRNYNIRVAGIDHRLTPDIGDFLWRTVDLIEETYRANGDTPVHLVGHNTGPVYSQYLLTHTTQGWKDKYIHGQTPIAGDWAGQGGFYEFLVFGFNFNDLTYPTTKSNAISSSRMYLSHPSSYMTCMDPRISGDEIVVLREEDTGKEYTAADAAQIFEDAGLPVARELADYYIGFVRFNTPEFYPNVDTYGEYGSGFETEVGLVVDKLEFGQVFTNDTEFITRPDGDNDQEDITNESFLVWSNMECFRFEPHVNPGVRHIDLIADPNVLGRLIRDLRRPRSKCRPSLEEPGRR